jgi:predicted nucleic-acid-binding protein
MGDDPVQSPASAAFMYKLEEGTESAEIAESVVTEAVWTLSSFYEVPRVEVADKLAAILDFPGVRAPRKKVLMSALARYGAGTADIVDCLLAARAAPNRATVITFDATDFKKLGVQWKKPS